MLPHKPRDGGNFITKSAEDLNRGAFFYFQDTLASRGWRSMVNYLYLYLGNW